MSETNGGPVVETARELWRPSVPEETHMHRFMLKMAEKHRLSFDSYDDLYSWSIKYPAVFWEEVWHYTGLKSHKPYSNVLEENTLMFPRPTFFEGSLMNFAENMLFPPSNPNEDDIAIIAATESSRKSVSWMELRDSVRLCAIAMQEAGVVEGDRIAGYVGNHADTLIIMLAATSLGALWSGVSTDTGVHAVLERLRQIEPRILFVDNASLYNGKIHSTHAKVAEIGGCLDCLERVVVIDAINGHQFDTTAIIVPNGRCLSLVEFTSQAKSSLKPLEFKYLPPDHPVYILYSSGTTGAPKPIVHGSLGTLLQHKKEHVLHSDIRPGDRVFYFTTTTWMMWHWLVSALASGASLVLYDGSPFRPLDHEDGKGGMAMTRLIDELKVTHFGTSAKYLSILEQSALNPRKHPHRPVKLDSLRAIFSTGSSLAPSTFDYVYSTLHSGVMLGSITGGTDIISLFGASCPILPVHRGEIQCRGLGMAVAVFDYAGNDIGSSGEAGDLVCLKPFPSQPVMFWPPGTAGADKYRSCYFETFGPHIWHHGDYMRMNPVTCGLSMLGRSDGVLKPAGVRFGSAEIYNVILKHFSDLIEDSLCIGRKRDGIEADEVVILFVKLMDNPPSPSFEASGALSIDLVGRIQTAIRKELSARHVPTIVDACPEIPITSNGKKVENAVKQILCGLNIKTGASVANAGCLDWYRNWAAEH